MSELRCLYTSIDAPFEAGDLILRDLVMPVAREVCARPELDSLFFCRYNDPTWQIRFRVVGEPRWIERSVKPSIESRIGPLEGRDVAQGHVFGEYMREVERYGGEEGMWLTERLYHHDSLACLDLIELEARGEMRRTRREFSLRMVERLLDLMRFDRERRLAFYARGYGWAVESGTLNETDLAALEKRYESVKGALADLAGGERGSASASLWGGERASAIAEKFLAAAAPVVDKALEAHAEGRVRQDLVELAWSWAHLHSNRIGVMNVGEASLRFFMHRLYQEGLLPAGT